MSSTISGVNIKNIYEYDSNSSYEKYDVVDYQLTVGPSFYPSYTGLGQTGLHFWFNNEFQKDFLVDSRARLTGWASRGSGEVFLTQDGDDNDLYPLLDFNANYTSLNNEQLLTGKGLSFESRTMFVCFEAYPHSDGLFSEQNIFAWGDSDYGNYASSGTLSIGGQDNSPDNTTYARIYLDSVGYIPVCPIYNEPNIITIVQSYNGGSKNLKLRQNGYEIADINTFNDGWMEELLLLGDTKTSNGVKYYDVFSFTGVLSESEIDKYEKYLFEKYFHVDGFYYAKDDVEANELFSPITRVGKYYYWTRDLRDLFKLSYGSSFSAESNSSTVYFGDGYQSSVSKNINNLLISYKLKYEGLTDRQAKCLIAFFQNTPNNVLKSEYEGFNGVNLDLFTPHKKNAEVYFLDIDHQTPYNDINNITIDAKSVYETNLNYLGYTIALDEVDIRTYTDSLEGFEYNDVVYLEDEGYNNRGYYFYTGQATSSSLETINGPLGLRSDFTRSFYFKPDVDYSVNSSLKLGYADLKGSTVEYFKASINPNLLEFDLKFSNRSEKEARAILKFFDDRAGFKLFSYTLPQPYNKNITVYCPQWSHEYNFKDNHTINAKFLEFRGALAIETGDSSEEVNVEIGRKTVFNTIITFFKC
tara:strand:+ start:7321 stop:9243 length:1923 start_codon:yes stop_codon:yes gene_type:complete